MKSSVVSGNIEIKRNKGKLSSLSVVMPVWDKENEDGFLSVNIPLFAISTFAKDHFDVDEAVRESVTLFCINSERFGKGLETELKVLGWSFAESKEGVTSMSFKIPQKNRVFGDVMQTGEQFVDELSINC